MFPTPDFPDDTYKSPIERVPIKSYLRVLHGPSDYEGTMLRADRPLVVEELPGPNIGVMGPPYHEGGAGCCTTQSRQSLSTWGGQSTSTCPGLIGSLTCLPGLLALPSALRG